MTPSGARVDFADCAPAGDGDWLAAFELFKASADAMLGERAPLRVARAATSGLKECAAAARGLDLKDDAEARSFFAAHFHAWRVGARGEGFLTGYYEPRVFGSRSPTAAFTAPILARPRDLAMRSPYPTRAEIERNGGEAIVWLRDAVEVFFIHVQGSGRVVLPDGSELRLIYDGRNGRPYTSIGRLAIQRGAIGEEEMSLARLKRHLRESGVLPGQPGRALMQENESYIFFRAEPVRDADEGPIGGAGRPLKTLRAIAVDRSLWAYGTPFFIRSEIPWRKATPEAFARPMIALDTGSAIVGPARADLFFGSGDEAGARAGDIRHAADFVALLPRGEEPHGGP